jgi:guanine deaminase
VELARESASDERGQSGPFGAIVVRDDTGEVIGEGHNMVVTSCDPTAHAEIVALRDAAAKTKTHVLTGATLYTSTEPCPMCLGAAYWARVSRIVIAADRQDAASVGFDDSDIYDEVASPRASRRIPIVTVRNGKELGRIPFEAWRANKGAVHY